MMEVEVAASGDVPRDQVVAARERMASLQKYVSEPLIGARIVLRRGSPHSKLSHVADASVLFDGRLLAAHAVGPTALAAAATERLRRQLLRVAGTEVAKPHEPRNNIEAALTALADGRHRPEAQIKPPSEREIVHRHTHADEPLGTLPAVADLLDLDEEFHLFRHVRTGEDVVVYRRDDGRIGLIYPQGSALANENDIVVAQPSSYSSPLTFEAARSEMDELNHRFLYFIDAADGRGKVLYLRHDGDYGLVQPA